ncbi:MAG: EboA domain-containing protein, partial [Alphaproteobacteria bacterium]|nr:EboA domain-containing protein [Alphaproteobacteria bacterium]
GWSLAEAARAWALLAASPVEVPPLFRTGDTAERVAILKCLALLPDPAAHVGLAVEALRSHVQDVFEALACDNSYPAAWLPEANFNQMVLKALFTGAPLSRVRGLSDRLNPTLVRMCVDYAAERRAAGRVVPPDIALITGGPP